MTLQNWELLRHGRPTWRNFRGTPFQHLLVRQQSFTQLRVGAAVFDVLRGIMPSELLAVGSGRGACGSARCIDGSLISDLHPSF
jgi:hypothetical protein